jgi:hypothetical protein
LQIKPPGYLLFPEHNITPMVICYVSSLLTITSNIGHTYKFMSIMIITGLLPVVL